MRLDNPAAAEPYVRRIPLSRVNDIKCATIADASTSGSPAGLIKVLVIMYRCRSSDPCQLERVSEGA